MKRFRWQIALGLSFVLFSFFIYLLHYLIFRDQHHIFLYLIGDLAFLPIQVLLVTMIIDRLLNVRERNERLEKLNMVIGAFFSEVGTRLLAYFSDGDPTLDRIRQSLIVTKEWSDEAFYSIRKRLKLHEYGVEIQKFHLEDLRSFLGGKRDFLLRLLENPNLLEHESFTELLRAVFHLTEELESRVDVKQLPEKDREHLAEDIKRAYISLVHEWWDYMKHLKNNYPYLFSLAMRTNPFDRSASPIVM
jgi:hypothetical protein